MTMEMRALARLAENKVIQDVVKDFRDKHHDWKDLAAYLMTKHTSREFKKKKTKTKKSKVKVNVKASETLVKSYLSNKLGDAKDSEHSTDDETMEIEKSDGEDNEDKSDSDDSGSEASSKHASQQIGKAEEEEEEGDSEASDSGDGCNETSKKHVLQQIYKAKNADHNTCNEEEEEEEEDSESEDSGDDETQGGFDEHSGESERENDSSEEVGSDEDQNDELDSEQEDESDLEELSSSEIESKSKTKGEKDSPNKSKRAKKSKVDRFFQLLFQGKKEKGSSDRKRTLDESKQSGVHLTKDVEKKSGDMIVKRLKLTDDVVEDKSQVPDILLGVNTEPAKKKKKRKDPFFDSGVDNGSDSDDDSEDKAASKNWSKDTDRSTKFDYMSEKEMGMKALSTTFLGSLNSGKMMECNDPAYRTNAEWKQIREDKFSGRQVQ